MHFLRFSILFIGFWPESILIFAHLEWKIYQALLKLTKKQVINMATNEDGDNIDHFAVLFAGTFPTLP